MDDITKRNIYALYNEYQSTVEKMLLLIIFPVLLCCFAQFSFVKPSRWSVAGVVYVTHTRLEGPLPTQRPPSPATTTSNSLQLSSRTGV